MSTSTKAKFAHQISITSKTAVGKSSLLKALKEKLNHLPYRWVSGGSLMRERAAKLGMTIEEFALHNKLHPEEGHDKWCDDAVALLAQDDWMICEGRLPHVFMPRAFKVLLVCNSNERARRRSADKPQEEFLKVLQDIEDRDLHDGERYSRLYPGWQWGPEEYDLVLDTGLITVRTEVERVLNGHEKWNSGIN